MIEEQQAAAAEEAPPAEETPEPQADAAAQEEYLSKRVAETVQAPMEETSPAAAISPNYWSDTPPQPVLEVDDHWSPYQVPEVPKGAEVYIIRPNDTLWDIAETHAGDPYLWPHLWDNNLYITDPHWIYPGDPLFLKPVIILTPDAMAKAIEEAVRVEDMAEVEPKAVEEEEVEVALVEAEKLRTFIEVERRGPQPAASYDEVYCSYFIRPKAAKDYDIRVAALEEEAASITSAFKIVYLDKGYEDGVEPGQEYAAFHVDEEVSHPVKKRNLGNAVYRAGRVRVLAVQRRTATAKVVYSCRELVVGDMLAPWEEIPIPLHIERVFEPTAYLPSGKSLGYIVYAKDDIRSAATRSIVSVDLGEAAGLAPGDYLTVYYENPAGPAFQRQAVAELIVLSTQDRTATCKVMRAYREADIGARVEVQ
ncbi:MAG: LysM peptidoglycan-binding domain-containing protein [Acidobacteriota bacterium]|nr:MAG: LysM peptidoglycan-binding domain-containing protein [Acidobacteriota bacterium]